MGRLVIVCITWIWRCSSLEPRSREIAPFVPYFSMKAMMALNQASGTCCLSAEMVTENSRSCASGLNRHAASSSRAPRARALGSGDSTRASLSARSLCTRIFSMQSASNARRSSHQSSARSDEKSTSTTSLDLKSNFWTRLAGMVSRGALLSKKVSQIVPSCTFAIRCAPRSKFV